MTDQYYRREDQVPETAETALANWKSNQSQMAAFVPEAAADLNRTAALLNAVLEQVQGDAETQDRLNDVWQIAEKLANRIGQMDAHAQLAQTAITKLNKRRTQLRNELDALNDAIDTAASRGWSTHPRLVELTTAIREEIAEMYAEEMEEDGGYLLESPEEQAYELGWWDCIQQGAIEDLLNALFKKNWASRVPTELRDSLSRAINAFSDEFTEHIEESRMQVEQMLMDEDEATE